MSLVTGKTGLCCSPIMIATVWLWSATAFGISGGMPNGVCVSMEVPGGNDLAGCGLWLHLAIGAVCVVGFTRDTHLRACSWRRRSFLVGGGGGEGNGGLAGAHNLTRQLNHCLRVNLGSPGILPTFRCSGSGLR
jgi:hypothetical protein